MLEIDRVVLPCLLALGLVWSGSAGAQTPTTAPPLIVPDLDTVPPQLENGVIIDQPTQVECGGQTVTPTRAEALPPGLTNRPVGPRPFLPPPAYTLAFSIGEDGRPHAIRPDPQPNPEAIELPYGTHGAQATLMGWRFEPRARSDCRLTVQPSFVDIADASEALKARAIAISGARANWRPALLRALERPGDDCRHRPAYRTVSNGRRDSKPAPGTRAWAAYRFDVDAQGHVHNIESLEASPDPDLVAELLQVQSEMEYQPGPVRKGCILALSRYGDPAPPGPVEMPDWRPLNRCTPEQRARFTPGQLVYPDAFLDRGIEGWALIRFDLASWGRVGGIELIQAEPAGAFGDQAKRIIQQGRAVPALEHAPDCVDRVVFRLTGADRSGSDED